MFKVGDKGKTRGGWDYEIIQDDKSKFPFEVRHFKDGRTFEVWHGPDGTDCSNDPDPYWAMLPADTSALGCNVTWQQAVKDFALHFIETYNPANAADIATAALEFTGED